MSEITYIRGDATVPSLKGGGSRPLSPRGQERAPKRRRFAVTVYDHGEGAS